MGENRLPDRSDHFEPPSDIATGPDDTYMDLVKAFYWRGFPHLIGLEIHDPDGTWFLHIERDMVGTALQSGEVTLDLQGRECAVSSLWPDHALLYVTVAFERDGQARTLRLDAQHLKVFLEETAKTLSYRQRTILEGFERALGD